MRPSCQTLSNAFDMSVNTHWTIYSSSNNAYIAWVTDKSWLRKKSPGLKPDWFVEIRLLVMKRMSSLEKIILDEKKTCLF